MSDEEKKTIESLKTEYEKLIKEDNILFPLYKSDDKRLIDIIKKQSKEIEELKKPKYIIDIKTNEIKKLTNDFVSKDKIKAKIEEVEQWELYNMKIPRLNTLDERLGAKIGIKYVLQSLLEKE